MLHEPASVSSTRSTRLWVEEFLAKDTRISRINDATTASEIPSEKFEREVISQIRKERLAYFIASSGSFKYLSDSLQANIREIALREAANALVVSRDLLRISESLTAKGIPHLFYKGVLLSLLTQGNLTARGGGDIDILVSQNDVLDAHKVLMENGAHSGFRMVPSDRTSFSFYMWLHKELPYPVALSEIDLHWRITSPVGITPRTEALLSRARNVSFFDQAVKTLDDCDAKVIAAYTFYVDGAKSLRQLLDFQLLADCNSSLHDGYSAELNSLVAAVSNHAAKVFSLSAAGPTLDSKAIFYSERIAKNWESSGLSKPKEEHSRITLKQHLESLKIETSLGKPIPNFIRVVFSKVLDFKGTNFNRDRLILAKALFREIAGQIMFMRRPPE